ncbi:MAG: DUF177 domain-containing protein [Bacilli bacterium]|nr:DUF177 domain-containing protein [Bacilli bacterium]MDE6141987.1 DUF177 domain-containing protein [Bacilli bacterium]
MKIDLNRLNAYNIISVDNDITINKELYQNTDVRDIKDLHIKGNISINISDEIELDLDVSGVFILPCAITLEDVEYKFTTKIEEIWGKFNDFYDNYKNNLDICPIIWENIVSEVPMRVVKEGINSDNLNGDGWELVSSD